MIRRSTLPPRKLLLETFSYDRETGILCRRKIEKFQNKRLRGAEAGCREARGYRCVKIGGKSYKTHRIIWKMAFGTEPLMIDHRNGKLDDNRLANLRRATPSQNAANCTRRKGKLLPKGVKLTRSGGYSAVVRWKNKSLYLGTYRDSKTAHSAYIAKAKTLHRDFLKIA